MKKVMFDLTGQNFGRLLVIEYSHQSRANVRLYKCLCDCGKEVFATVSALRKGTKKSCGCLRAGKNKRSYTGYEDISGGKWYAYVKGAEARKLTFNITKEQVWTLFEAQGRKCALTGREISFKGNLRISASIDRIDPKRGYEIDNIQLVHKHVNIMKNRFTDEEYIAACRSVVNISNTKSTPVIVGIDFDGTIVEEKYPNIGNLKPHAREAIRMLYEEGFYIILWTCRTGAFLQEAISFLNKEGIPFHQANDHHPEIARHYGGKSQKLLVDISVDDKNIEFIVNGIPSWDILYIMIKERANQIKKRALSFKKK